VISYNKSKDTIIQNTGITEDEIQKIENLQNFNFDIFRDIVKDNGFSVVIGNLLNDLVDEYLDEENNQKLFGSYRARVAVALPTQAENIFDENNQSISLTIHGADDSNVSMGFLVDVVATKKETITNEDGEEIEEDQTVFLGFNIGEYKGQLNSETTILAKIFMSDMELALLPNDAKESLVSKLLSENKELYENVQALYKFVIREGLFYEPLFDEKFELLLGKAQIINNQHHKAQTPLSEIQTKQIKLQKQVLLYSQYRQSRKIVSSNLAESSNEIEPIKKQLAPYLNLEYDSEKHEFSVTNQLPIYLGIRESKISYDIWENFIVPLVEPAEGGGLGYFLSDSETVSTIAEWGLGLDLNPQTSFAGELLAPDLFPSASQAVKGYREFEIFKNGLDMPTIKNVGLGISAIFKFLSGSGVSKTFDKAMISISKGLDTSKKVLGYAQTGVDIATGFSQFLYLMIDEQLDNPKTFNLTNEKINILKNRSNYLKGLYKDAESAGNLISTFSSLIPDMSTRVVENDAGYFLTTIGNKDNKTFLGSSIIANITKLTKWKTLSENEKKEGFLTIKQAATIIVGGNILKNSFNKFDKKELYDLDITKNLVKKAKDFKTKWNMSIGDFGILHLYFLTTGGKKVTIRLWNKILGSSNLHEPQWKEALLEYKIFMTEGIIKGNIQKIFTNKIASMLNPVNVGKKLASWKRLSVNDAFSFAKDVIVKEIKKSGKALLKGAIQSAVKQVALITASGGSAAVIKIVQGAELVNELGGLGVAMYATPNVIPFAIEIDHNGNLTYKEPKMRVLGASNTIVPNNTYFQSEILKENKFTILSKSENDTSVLVVTTDSITNPSRYDLSYKIYYNNTAGVLKGIYGKNSDWYNSIAIKAGMSISKKVSYNSKTSSEVEYKFWDITPEELSAKVKENSKVGSEIDLISILNKQEEGFLENLLSPKRSTTIANLTRGFFTETFLYDIYEPINSPVKNKITKIENFQRSVFKISNAKKLQKDFTLYHYDETHIAISNDTGHDVLLLETYMQGDEITSYGNQYSLSNGETKLFDKDMIGSLFAIDSLVLEYGKSKGLASLESTLDYLSNIKDNFISDYMMTIEEVKNANEETKEHSFILNIKKEDFTDIIDTQNQIDEENILSIIYNDDAKVFLTSFINSEDYVMGQYKSNNSKNYGEGYEESENKFDEISYTLESGSLIPNSISKDVVDADVIKPAHESELVDNYIIKDIRNYSLTKDYDEKSKLIGFTLINESGNKIKFSIIKYQEDTNDVQTLYLHIEEGIENFIECKNTCIDISKFNFNFIISTNDALYDDGDNDYLIDLTLRTLQ